MKPGGRRLKTVLIVAPSYPWPPADGGRIGMLYHIRALAERAVAVHLICTPQPSESTERSPLDTWCTSICTITRPPAFKVAWRRPWLPYQSVSRVRPALLQAVARHCEVHRPDIVHLEHTYLAPVRQAIPMHLPVVLGVHNLEAAALRARAASLRSFPKRLPFLLEAMRMAAFEQWWFRRGAISAWLFVSEDERREIEEKFASLRGRCWHLPPGVDLPPERPHAPQGDAFVFVGSLWFDPNIDGLRWFTRRVWPLVRLALPHATLVVAGRRPSPHLAMEMRSVPGIEFLGEVPDVEPVYDRARVIVLPVRHGAGVKVKSIEALSRGVPCVGTSHAFEGLAIDPNRVAGIADDPRELAAQCIAAWRGDDSQQRRAQQARGFVRAHHAWNVVAERYVTLLASVAREAGP